MENEDLKYIKKFYGEKFAHYCRSNFPTILENPGELKEIISNTFAPTKFLNEIIDNEDSRPNLNLFIMSKYFENHNIKVNSSNLSAKELLDKAGYILYPECKTEEDIQYFKKFYKKGEELCTFNGGRLNTCRVWFAVKKNIDSIVRENFANPQRQDEYGTSVISIQFTREGNFLSIKNRYNHTVDHPDSTFSNNLDNIALGLTDAYKKEFGLESVFKTNFKNLESYSKYVLADDGKYHHVNFKPYYSSYLFCENNYLMDVDTKQFQKVDTNSLVFMDKYIVDLQKKTILSKSSDSFTETFKSGIKDVSVIKNEDKTRTINFVLNDENVIKIKLNNQNNIEEYYNKEVKHINNAFLFDNTELKKVELPEVEEIDNRFLYLNNNLESLELPKVKRIQDECLSSNLNLKKFYLPNLISVGDCFLQNNKNVEEINLPNLKAVGDYFMINNVRVEDLNVPLLESAGDYFLQCNNKIKEINLTNIKLVGNNFMIFNDKAKQINAPLLEGVGKNFLLNNIASLHEINLPNLKTAGDNFMENNHGLEKIDAPKLESVGKNFLCYNKKLNQVKLPKLERAGEDFLHDFMYAEKIKVLIHKKIELPNLKNVDESFFEDAPKRVCRQVRKNYKKSLKENAQQNVVKDSVKENANQTTLVDKNQESLDNNEMGNLTKDENSVKNLIQEDLSNNNNQKPKEEDNKENLSQNKEENKNNLTDTNIQENLTEENKTEKLDSNKVEELSSNKTEELTSTKNKENITNNNVDTLDEDEEELVLKR